jgi:hypothetical protein
MYSKLELLIRILVCQLILPEKIFCTSRRVAGVIRPSMQIYTTSSFCSVCENANLLYENENSEKVFWQGFPYKILSILIAG